MRLTARAMTQGFAMEIKAGGDPRELPDYRRLCIEMARMGHPACPDVDWQSIEQCCLALFASHGADLQTAAAYALARSHLAGVDGMFEGVAVLESLLRADAKPWPRGVSARAEILGGVFGSWQAVLRELDINPCDRAGLNLLSTRVGSLRQTLVQQHPQSLIALDRLHEQIGQRVSRLERDAQALGVVGQQTARASTLPTSADSPVQRAVQGSTQRNRPGTQRKATPPNPPLQQRRALRIGWLAAALFGCLIVLAAGY
ncbi:type VI secretion system ImpA family N-terminal domain-containing protein [Pseudomonas sp. W5-01]|uniref:type VI secretion system ImpA family N-terminal domain-containing protein n=1 Tax=Pseudomonas sp. W5-01 TaxID=3097454 RepID=UPI00397E30DF